MRVRTFVRSPTGRIVFSTSVFHPPTTTFARVDRTNNLRGATHPNRSDCCKIIHKLYWESVGYWGSGIFFLSCSIACSPRTCAGILFYAYLPLRTCSGILCVTVPGFYAVLPLHRTSTTWIRLLNIRYCYSIYECRKRETTTLLGVDLRGNGTREETFADEKRRNGELGGKQIRRIIFGFYLLEVRQRLF